MKRELAFCLVCVLTGMHAPWAFILGGAMVGYFAQTAYWAETGVWVMAIGFLLLSCSYFFARLFNRFIYDQKH